MKIKFAVVSLALINLIGASKFAIADEQQPHTFVKIYLVSWDSQLLNKESIETIRKGADVYSEIREKYYARDLLKALQVDQLEKSDVPAAESFKLQLVIDVPDQKQTYLSDGKQLCDRSLKHCISVDQNRTYILDIPSLKGETKP